MRRERRLGYAVIAAGAFVALATRIVVAQSVNDFKNAADSKGCGLIVYSSQRSTCDDRGPRIEDYCKRRTWSCDGLDPEGIKKNIENVKGKIESLKKERDELESKKNGSKDDSEKRDLDNKIADKKKEIEQKEALVAEWQRKIEDEKKEIAARLSIGKQCREYRVDVQKAFAETKSKLQSESNADVKPHAEKIIKKIESEESGHKDAIDFVDKGIYKCDRM